MIFKMCYAFKMPIWDVMDMTIREIAFLLSELKEYEVYDQANKISLAGGDGQQFLATRMNESSVDESDFVDNDKLENFIQEELK